MPDGHADRHRTVRNYASYLASKRRYQKVYGYRDVERWRARHPALLALQQVRSAAKRRGAHGS